MSGGEWSKGKGVGSRGGGGGGEGMEKCGGDGRKGEQKGYILLSLVRTKAVRLCTALGRGRQDH
jgi:hypothetical protein